MLTKAIVKQQIDSFPEVFSIDEIVEKLILIDKIERGNEQSMLRQVITEEQVDKNIEEWFK